MKAKLVLTVVIFLLATSLLKADPDSSLLFFGQSYEALKDMLENRQPISFEKAVYFSESPYLDNKISYHEFSEAIEAHIYFIKRLIKANDKEAAKNFSVNLNSRNVADLRFTESEKRNLYRRALANWAIFKYITDTTSFFNYVHLPYLYQVNDPFGMTDWKNSQVMQLLTTNEQKGNCLALVFLYKILSERLNSKAYICTAPQHIYIEHQDDKGDYYNVELATHTFPGDGSIQTLTYTYHEAIANGIALRRLSDVQDVALCLVNLGKSYEHKFNTRNADFILKCANLALQYDSLNLNAMLLKEEVLEARVAKNKLRHDTTYESLQQQIIKLYDLGYHQMPLYMQQMILSKLKSPDTLIFVQNRTPNPFSSITVPAKDKRYSTLSGGIFEEVHDKKQFEEYGHIIFDTEKKRIVKIDTTKNTELPIDPAAFAWSVDPLSHDYADWSPYSAFSDNPVLNIDPTGAAVDGGPPKGSDVFLTDDDESGSGTDDKKGGTTPSPASSVKTPGGNAPTLPANTKTTPANPPAGSNNNNNQPSGFNQALITINEFNPIANLYNAIDGMLTGYDVNGRPQSSLNIGLNILGAIPFVSLESGESKGLLKLGEEATNVAKPYTVSNLKMGQEMHKAYKVGLADDINTFKEFRLPSGRKIDFLDISNPTIFELKPYNPRAMQQGTKQLEEYMQELQTMPRFQGIQWTKVLDTY